MARAQSQKPALTQGNVIYLYGLLAREIGCGKQTFLPRVEEALLTDSMTAEDLGFKDTRTLLEALGDCVNLTVFKGGRIYATVIAQPAWDEALTTPVDTKTDATAKGGRPWKRKKSDKSLKPVKPRRVKRETVEPEPMPESELELESETESVPEPESIPEPETEQMKQNAEAAEAVVETFEADEPAEPAAPVEVQPESESEPESKPEPKPMAEEPQPSISLTITYDPYSENDGETTLEASREALAATAPKPNEPSSPVEPLTAQTQVPEASAPSAPIAPTPSPEALASYPQDFIREVYCPAEYLAELNGLLPLGTAAMPLLTEDFQRALDLRLVTGTRSRATFPLRVQHLDAVAPITVTIRKQSGPGLPWAISHIQ